LSDSLDEPDLDVIMKQLRCNDENIALVVQHELSKPVFKPEDEDLLSKEQQDKLNVLLDQLRKANKEIKNDLEFLENDKVESK
jgi:hypothetical protein